MPAGGGGGVSPWTLLIRFACCTVSTDKMKINPVNVTSQSAPSQGLLFIQQSENADRRPGKILRRRHPRSGFGPQSALQGQSRPSGLGRHTLPLRCHTFPYLANLEACSQHCRLWPQRGGNDLTVTLAAQTHPGQTAAEMDLTVWG